MVICILCLLSHGVRAPIPQTSGILLDEVPSKAGSKIKLHFSAVLRIVLLKMILMRFATIRYYCT